MEQGLLERINELAKKQREGSLTAEEAIEQAELRRQYIAEFRGSMKNVLDNTYIQYENGEKVKLKKNQ